MKTNIALAAILIILIAALAVFYVQNGLPGLPSLVAKQEASSATPIPYQSFLEDMGAATEFTPNAVWLNTEEPITLETIKGKVSVVYFWRSFCSYCQDAPAVR